MAMKIKIDYKITRFTVICSSVGNISRVDDFLLVKTKYIRPKDHLFSREMKYAIRDFFVRYDVNFR